MPIYKLVNEMPYEELIGWISYFEKRPIGWREDDRTFKLLQAQGVKEKPGAIFTSLQKIYNLSSRNTEPGRIDSSFMQSVLFSKILTAKGGDKIL